MAESKLSPISLQLERVFAHAPEKVFDAWTQAGALARWFAPTDDYTSIVHTLELTPGGRYRIEMKPKSGPSHTVLGRYVEVLRPERLVFTWAWEDGFQPGETLVTVEFKRQGAGTLMTLIHERFIDDDQREKHNQGWLGCLGRLERQV